MALKISEIPTTLSTITNETLVEVSEKVGASYTTKKYDLKKLTTSPLHGDEAHTEDYVKEGDPRLSDARTPTEHGGEAHTEDYIKEGDDRLADARMPLAHAQTHVDGTDDIQLATSSQKGLMSSAYAAKLDGIEENANNYSLPTASETVKGGIKVGSGLTMEGETLNADVQTKTHWVNMVIDWGGSTIEPGIKGDLTLPACTITEVMLLANESGSIVIDLWKGNYANFPPTEANSITGSSKPTISSSTKFHDSALTGWTTNIAEDDILRVNVDSCTAIKRCTLALKLIV